MCVFSETSNTITCTVNETLIKLSNSGFLKNSIEMKSQHLVKLDPFNFI